MNLKKMWKRFWNLNVHNHEGFTLVELIIVIAILAILSSVAVVGYSSYIEKANKATDDELLRLINQAFQSACLENGIDTFDVKSAEWDMANMTVKTVEGSATNSIIASFNKFFGSTSAKFKGIEELFFNPLTHQFVDANEKVEVTYKGQSLQLSAKDLALLSNSTLGELGAETLLTETAGAIAWADSFGLTSMGGEAYWNAVKSYLGLSDLVIPEGADPYVFIMYQLKEKKGYTEDEAGAMMSNATALYVAESAGDVTKDGVLAWLGGSTDDLQNSASANTLGEASAIYALWIAYKGDDFDNRDGDTLLAMGDALSDEEFANWVRTDPAAQTELEAFQAAMSIINDAADEEEARQVLLANGFDDPELIALLTGLMGN